MDEATEWTEHRLEPLSGYPYYKLRAGDYRVIVSWNRGEDRLVVEAVGHRRNIYDRHLPPYANTRSPTTPTATPRRTE